MTFIDLIYKLQDVWTTTKHEFSVGIKIKEGDKEFEVVRVETLQDSVIIEVKQLSMGSTNEDGCQMYTMQRSDKLGGDG